MATLHEYYDTDFARLLTAPQTIGWQHDSTTGLAEARVHFDFDSNAKFISCLLPPGACNKATLTGLLRRMDELLAIGSGLEFHLAYCGETARSSFDLQFAGRLFIYHEADIDQGIQDAIRAEALQQRIFVQFRGPGCATARTALERPLAFISHDSRDKETVARPLAIGLSKLMCPVWFDEFSLKVGDRLRESIEHGLCEAPKCILILTPHFLGNAGWTKQEFNAVFTRELIEKKDVILPVWNDVTPERVYAYSPSLVDRVAVDWRLGADEVARRLKHAIGV